MGDPAGIGLEIAAMAWARREELALPPFCLIADVGAAGPAARDVASLDAAAAMFPRHLPVLHRPLGAPAAPGSPRPEHAQAIIGAIREATELALCGEASGIVTLPIAKAPLYAAGFRFPGHTEFIADLCATPAPIMMLAGPSLRVALATIHVPLAQVSSLCTRARIVEAGTIVLDALHRDFCIASPRLAVAGLNPHAGEEGKIGREDGDEIAPAVADLRAAGYDAAGPFPADSLFHAGARARYDAVLAMYHDQGLGPLKTLHFWDAVNITLGLPIIRTSPDHGVAYDIAGTGRARPDSFIEALRTARDMAANRARVAA